MLPYAIVFIVISLNAFINKKNTRIFNLILFVFFILFYAMRNEVGTDWASYEYYFNNVYNKYVLDQYSFEFGYWIMNYLARFFFSSFRYLVFLVGIFNGVLFWKATNRYTKNIGIVVLLSLFYMFYPTLEAFRQSITLFLFYYSLEYIEKNEKKYILLNLIGFLFHLSGIFTLLFFVFNKYKKIRIFILSSMVAFNLIEPYFLKIISVYPILYNKYYWYFYIEGVRRPVFTFKTLEYLILVMFYYISNKKIIINKWNKLIVNLLLLGLFIQITIGQMSNVVYRMTYYTDIGIIFAYTFIYDRIKKKVFKYLYLVFLIIYILLRLYRVFPFDDPRFIYTI